MGSIARVMYKLKMPFPYVSFLVIAKGGLGKSRKGGNYSLEFVK